MIGLKGRALPQSGTLVDRVIADLENTVTRLNDVMGEVQRLRDEVSEEVRTLRRMKESIRSDIAAVTVNTPLASKDKQEGDDAR